MGIVQIDFKICHLSYSKLSHTLKLMLRQSYILLNYPISFQFLRFSIKEQSLLYAAIERLKKTK